MIDSNKTVLLKTPEPVSHSLLYTICMYYKTCFGVNHAIIHLDDVSQAYLRTCIDSNLPCASNKSHKNQRFGKKLAFSLEASGDFVDQPVIIPAPALSLVLIASGVAMGLESPPLPALEETGQPPASVSEHHYSLGIALRGSAGGVGHRPLNLGNISTEDSDRLLDQGRTLSMRLD
jgi:hypothetical protein